MHDVAAEAVQHGGQKIPDISHAQIHDVGASAGVAAWVFRFFSRPTAPLPAVEKIGIVQDPMDARGA